MSKRKKVPVFYLAGTILIGVMLVIVSINFVRDARLLQLPAFAFEKGKPVKPGNTAAPKGGDEYQTLQYRKHSSDTEKGATKTGTKTTVKKPPVQQKIKVEIVNYTNVKGLAEMVGGTLEAAGYLVHCRNEKPDPSVTTLIIERNDKNCGSGIRKLLKAGGIVKGADSASKFDVTVRIGNDFKP